MIEEGPSADALNKAMAIYRKGGIMEHDDLYRHLQRMNSGMEKSDQKLKYMYSPLYVYAPAILLCESMTCLIKGAAGVVLAELI